MHFSSVILSDYLNFESKLEYAVVIVIAYLGTEFIVWKRRMFSEKKYSCFVHFMQVY